MSDQFDREELERARQLAAQLEGKSVPEPDPETADLARFAGSLQWTPAQPKQSFRTRLREQLLKAKPAQRPHTPSQPPRPARVRWTAPDFSWGSAIAVLLLIAVVVVAVLALMGPRIREIFGSVYNSLKGGGYYQQYNPPAYNPPANQPKATRAPRPTVGAPATPIPGVTVVAGMDAVPLAPVQHKIIKNADMDLLVHDTDTAVDRITGVAAQFGGYILSMQTWYDQEQKEATVVLAVPVDTFENVMRRLHEIALRVEREVASGQDVSAEYVDLQAQLNNLEATRNRIQQFLDKAQTVDEALNVNGQLSTIESQIEAIKGRMQYIEGRSSFSTITVNVFPQLPTPTPTPTSTPTPIPTATPTPTTTPTPTPVDWRPSKTLYQAGSTITGIGSTVGQFLWELLIWVVVVILPILTVPTLLTLLVRRFVLLLRQPRKGEQP